MTPNSPPYNASRHLHDCFTNKSLIVKNAIAATPPVLRQNAVMNGIVHEMASESIT